MEAATNSGVLFFASVTSVLKNATCEPSRFGSSIRCRAGACTPAHGLAIT